MTLSLWLLLPAAALYLLLASSVYRWRHPEMTETQLLLRLPAALAWRD